MEKILLPLNEVWNLHGERVCFTPTYSEADFDREWQAVRDNLRKTLRVHWKESCYGDADFALSDDRTNTWAQAGGINNEAILSKSFPKMIFKSLKQFQNGAKWGVLFSINIGKQSGTLNGEILLKNNITYIAEYKHYNSKLLFLKL